MATVPQNAPLSIRRARPEDVPECARICYDAFFAISTRHNFPPDFPSPLVPPFILGNMFSNPGFYCVVAEQDGRILGSNCMDERAVIAGIGPITVDPAVQDRGAGRALMQAVLDRAAERQFVGIRLVQAAFHNRSLSLYTKLGFDTREPLSCMQGTPTQKTIPGYTVRPAAKADLDACNSLCRRVHGFDRGADLESHIEQQTALVAEHAGRIAAYASALAFFGHAVAEDNNALQALIASVTSFAGPGILVPTRNAALFRWCLENGLKVVQPMTLMTIGLYNEPAGACLPSILF